VYATYPYCVHAPGGDRRGLQAVPRDARVDGGIMHAYICGYVHIYAYIRTHAPGQFLEWMEERTAVTRHSLVVNS